jgi:multidrug efflux pump subunit AcrB
VLAVQTPPYRIRSVDSLTNTPIISGINSSLPQTPTNLPPLISGGPGSGAPRQTPRGEAIEPPPQLLSNLAALRRTTSSAVVNHYNVQTVYEVYADVQGRDLGGVSSDVQSIVDSTRDKLPRGSTLAVRGQVQSMNSSFRGLAFGLLFAVLLVYFLMVVNFQSWLDPFIILTALPGALAGIVWMLYATHTTLSVPALMGTIMCIGVAMSNSILLVTFANDLRLDGTGAKEAAFQAGGIRLRPVLMTALAMIIGMLPMSLGLGEGGEQNAPLGRAVIGGLVVATFFTLGFVPVMYSLLRRSAPWTEPPDDDFAHGDEDKSAGDARDGMRER